MRYDTPASNAGISAAFALCAPGPWFYNDNLHPTLVETVYTVNHLPDFVANVRWESEKWGSAQLGAVARQLAIRDSSHFYDNQNIFAWGLSLSFCPNITAKDSLQLEANYGEGIFGTYINDGFRPGDIAIDRNGDLKALTCWGLLVGYTHKWSGKYRSSASYSMSNLKNDESQLDDTYHRVQYASVNFVWTIRSRFEAGIEVLYGQNEVKNGAKGDDVRTQVTFSYSLF